MSNPALKRCSFQRSFVHVSIKMIPGQVGKIDDVAFGNRMFVRAQRFANL